MSSTRDKSQSITFVYTNLHQIYRNAKAETTTGVERIDGSLALKVIQAPASPALSELRHNIDKLQDLHSRLHVMLKELEELVGVKKK